MPKLKSQSFRTTTNVNHCPIATGAQQAHGRHGHARPPHTPPCASSPCPAWSRGERHGRHGQFHFFLWSGSVVGRWGNSPRSIQKKYIFFKNAEYAVPLPCSPCLSWGSDARPSRAWPCLPCSYPWGDLDFILKPVHRAADVLLKFSTCLLERRND